MFAELYLDVLVNHHLQNENADSNMISISLLMTVHFRTNHLKSMVSDIENIGPYQRLLMGKGVG